MSSKPARKFSDAELCANFLDQLRSRGFHTVQAEVLDPRARNNFVPSETQDDTLSYIESISGKDKERAQVWLVGEEDVADLNDEAYAFEPVPMPVELSVIVHLGLGHEWLYGFGEGDVPVRCWSKTQAMRVPLNEIDQVIARLGKVDSVLEWA